MSTRFLGYLCGIFLSLLSTSFASNEQDLQVLRGPSAQLIPDETLAE